MRIGKQRAYLEMWQSSEPFDEREGHIGEDED